MVDQYRELTHLLSTGRKLSMFQIADVVQSSGKTFEDLIRDIHTRSDAAPVVSGSACECGGLIVVGSSKRKGIDRIQYLKCSECGQSHGKQIVPESQVFKRKKSFIPTIGKPDFKNAQQSK